MVGGVRECSRRAALRYAALAGAPTLAGCFDGGPVGSPTGTAAPTPSTVVDPAALPGAVRPSGEPRSVPDPLGCEAESFTRFDLPFGAAAVAWGTTREDGTPTFALRTDALAVERGDRVAITLTNLRATESTTGHRDLYTVEVDTTDGWQEVRGWNQGTPRPYPTIQVAHDPRAGFEWQLTLAEGELVEGHVHAEALTVCPGLPAGRYRFAYRGVEPGVAVAFDVVG